MTEDLEKGSGDPPVIVESLTAPPGESTGRSNQEVWCDDSFHSILISQTVVTVDRLWRSWDQLAKEPETQKCPRVRLRVFIFSDWMY